MLFALQEKESSPLYTVRLRKRSEEEKSVSTPSVFAVGTRY